MPGGCWQSHSHPCFSWYASGDYTQLLRDHQIQISMSRRGNPYDNAQAESFMKTLKYEEVYRTEYRDLTEAYASISEFIERVYNEQRLHSALGYVPPAEFEQNAGDHPSGCLAALFGIGFIAFRPEWLVM